MSRSLLRLAGLALWAAAAPLSARCEDLLPKRSSESARPVTSADLVRLRETGWADGDPGAPPPMSVSPDGSRLAIVVRRGDADPNRICVGLMVVGLDARTVEIVDASEDLLRDHAPWNGLLGQASGRPLFNQPLWGADGERLFYLRARNGKAQVWQVSLPRRASAPVTRAPDGVIHFGLTGDGRRLVYSTRAGLAEAVKRLEAEGRRGWIYDRRFAPVQSAAPHPVGVEAVAIAVDLATGAERPASSAEMIDSGVRLAEVSDALQVSGTGRGWRLWRAPERADRPFGPSRLHVAYRERELSCPDLVCGGTVWAAWGVGKAILVSREAEDRPGEIVLLRWVPGQAPRRLSAGTEARSGCVPAGAALICLEESATQPPRIVRVETQGAAAGRSKLLLDLNPEFAQLRLGTVRRLAWRDANDIAAYGDLVLPPDHRPGQRPPLVVVQYQSQGFLRGGSGNEFPIHPLAARGFAVLSVNQPRRTIAQRGADAPDSAAFQARMYSGLWQRRALLAALDAGIDAAIATGAVDPKRIGLTGMSDGAVTAVFAMIQHPRYKAAAIGPGWLDPVSYTAEVGPLFSDMVAKWGVPPPDVPSNFWRQVSLARNADRVTVPLLVQTGDAELRVALEGYEALRRAKRPVEMIVYPDEYHNKWQPSHLEAMYETCIDWFDFWLNGNRSIEPRRAARWAALGRQPPAGQPVQ